MAATIKAYVYTGTNAATESTTAVPDMSPAGISFLSIDSDSNAVATRNANPVVAGTTSFTKHLRLKATVAPSVSWGAVKFWSDGSAPLDSGSGANIAWNIKGTGTAIGQGTGGATPGTGGTTPTATALATSVSINSLTSGNKGIWDATTSIGGLNTVSKEIILQLAPTGSAAPGAMLQETLNYSYDEV